MALAKYREKRHFDKTPEPPGQDEATTGPLRFVVQKHRASRLHYDFRLELDGALKSWAVPKGPSLNPRDKRLAMMVEDHPLDYRTFEGIIPKGNYGAGEVIVWDEGPYCSRQSADRAESERLLREGLRDGHLTFVLSGQKLKGEFALLRLQRGAKNAWLLVKKKDQWASSRDVTKDYRSVASGRSLEDIAAGVANTGTPVSARAQPLPKDPPREKIAPKKRTTSAPRPPAPGEPALTNLTKAYWPDDGYTKGDLIDYYRQVAPVILPYLRDRPLSLHRHPNGIGRPSFFQKDISRQPPPKWVETTVVRSEGQERDIRYVLCQNEATLLYVANLGCIELNPWNSRVGSLDSPDYLVIDLDPEDVAFAQVVEAAVAVRKTLERAGAEGLCKTSGKRGLHIFVPLGARYSYDHAKDFAQIIATIVNRQLPTTTSLVRSPALRQGRVYLDCLQNRRGQTLAAAYSVRPQPGAPVSAPLHWREVSRRLDPARFTLKTLPARLDRVGDLWQPVVGAGIDLAACIERLLRTGQQGT